MSYIINAEEKKMGRELRRLAEFIPDEALPTESYHRIWNYIEQHIQPHPMKRIMNYLTKNLIPITIGIGIGIAISFLSIAVAFKII